jgi:hypothetical protein
MDPTYPEEEQPLKMKTNTADSEQEHLQQVEDRLYIQNVVDPKTMSETEKIAFSNLFFEGFALSWKNVTI